MRTPTMDEKVAAVYGMVLETMKLLHGNNVGGDHDTEQVIQHCANRRCQEYMRHHMAFSFGYPKRCPACEAEL